MTHYENLKLLTKKYGEKTAELNSESRRLGDMLLSSLPNFLECEKSKVYGVPPCGDFEPRADYRDACRSTYYQNICFLEPVTMGICVEIENLEDSGATWVRSIISIWKTGDQFKLLVGKKERNITLSNDFTSGKSELLEAIKDDIESAFSLELNDAEGRSRIGFFSKSL
ncbi:MAG: hypothetical protein COB40_02045 [Marinosulfonomonas sp.]|nr:MAG: hypothetical protein COB40_02045 [Marinosulfonomonas sp.]